jgi:hypothetical protein
MIHVEHVLHVEQGGGMTALEMGALIASLLRDELVEDVDVVDDAEPDGPLFAIVRVRGMAGRFAITVEEAP